MKATLDIPDELYRKVKARSALEGRSIRSVAIELFQNWLHTEPSPAQNTATTEELEEFPWLAITEKYPNTGISPDMDDIRESISRGWATERSVSSKSPSSPQS